VVDAPVGDGVDPAVADDAGAPVREADGGDVADVGSHGGRALEGPAREDAQAVGGRSGADVRVGAGVVIVACSKEHEDQQGVG
jgi:hypothetical protein